MPLSKRRFNVEVDELMEVRIKSLLGKSYINTKDVEAVLTTLVENTYNTNAGKRLKIN